MQRAREARQSEVETICAWTRRGGGYCVAVFTSAQVPCSRSHWVPSLRSSKAVTAKKPARATVVALKVKRISLVTGHPLSAARSNKRAFYRAASPFCCAEDPIYNSRK